MQDQKRRVEISKIQEFKEHGEEWAISLGGLNR